MNLATAACLPRDVLANVFLRLPAIHLRRLSRVCKEWHDIICSPVFVNDYMVHGPWAMTHTIVFLGGRPSKQGADTEPPRKGQGFLFDEQWRLAATFTTGESERMVGTCKGLLCFLDAHQGAIHVAEPFTGESLTLPMPPTSELICDPSAYCFGFDPGSRRYKIFHLGRHFLPDETWEQDLYLYTIGTGENWWSARVTGARDPCLSQHSKPVFSSHGSLYWSVDTNRHGIVARIDLATEEITLSEPIVDYSRVDDWGKRFHVMTDDTPKCVVMTVGPSGAWDLVFMGEDEGGRNSCNGGLTLPCGRWLALPQALQRGHLLLEDRDAGIYIHPIPSASNEDLGMGKLLLKIGNDEDKEPAKSSTRGLFVPALLNQVPAGATPGRGLEEWRTFCYAPPVSPASLGTPIWVSRSRIPSVRLTIVESII